MSKFKLPYKKATLINEVMHPYSKVRRVFALPYQQGVCKSCLEFEVNWTLLTGLFSPWVEQLECLAWKANVLTLTAEIHFPRNRLVACCSYFVNKGVGQKWSPLIFWTHRKQLLGGRQLGVKTHKWRICAPCDQQLSTHHYCVSQLCPKSNRVRGPNGE